MPDAWSAHCESVSNLYMASSLSHADSPAQKKRKTRGTHTGFLRTQKSVLPRNFDLALFDELVLAIFAWLPSADLCKVQCVNRHWARLALDNHASDNLLDWRTLLTSGVAMEISLHQSARPRAPPRLTRLRPPVPCFRLCSAEALRCRSQRLEVDVSSQLQLASRRAPLIVPSHP